MSHNVALSPDARYLIHDSYRPRMTQPDELPHTVWLVDTAEPWSLRRQVYPSTREPVPSDVGVSQAVTTNLLWSMDGTRVVFVRTPEIPGHGLDDPAGTTLVVVDVADGLDAVAVSEAPVNVLPGRLRWVEDETLAHQPYGAMPGLDETLLNFRARRPLTAEDGRRLDQAKGASDVAWLRGMGTPIPASDGKRDRQQRSTMRRKG